MSLRFLVNFLTCNCSCKEHGESDSLEAEPGPLLFAQQQTASHRFQLNERSISQKHLALAPQLHLSVQESKELELKQLFITAKGLAHCEREDGYVLFGSDATYSGSIRNDVIADTSQYGFGARHFMIFYDEDSNSFFIKDLGEGTGTFVNLMGKKELRDGMIVSFTDNHMVTNIDHDHALTIKFIEGSKVDETYKFTPDEEVRIGRTNACQVKFDESALSRVQTTVFYQNA